MQTAKKRFVLLAVFFIVAAACILPIYIRAKSDEPMQQVSLQELFESNPVLYLDLYYAVWSLKPFALITEDALMSEGHWVKIQYNIMHVRKERFEQLFKDAVLTPISVIDPDFRYVGVFHYGRESTRVSLAWYDPITLVINGVPYEAPPEIVDALIRLLPVRDYLEMRKYLQSSGFFEKGPILDNLPEAEIKAEACSGINAG
ncbi:MAG: hypothetical protein ACYS8Z_20080 [Planctomycetota bacterium]|jgi:hypothetical protein